MTGPHRQGVDPAGVAAIPEPAQYVVPPVHYVPPPPMPAGYAAGLSGVRETAESGPLWVRWAEFPGRTPWRRAVRVWRADSWLCVALAGGGELWTPDHVIRGQVEIRFSATTPTGAGT